MFDNELTKFCHSYVYCSILYNNPSKHIPNTLYDAGMQYPRKLGQGHIGLGRVDTGHCTLCVLMLRRIQDHRHIYIDLWCGRLFGLAWLEADENNSFVNLDCHSSQVQGRLCINVLLFF